MSSKDIDHRFLGVLILLLFVLSSTSASANVFVNGDFEVGSLDGWTSVNSQINSYPAHQYDGAYCALIYSYDGFDASLSQTVDLTGVDTLSFYAKETAHATTEVFVLFDYELVLSANTDTTDVWKYFEIDTSSYSGLTTVSFVKYADHDLFVDNVVAECTTDPFENCYFRFEDVDTGQEISYLNLNQTHYYQAVMSFSAIADIDYDYQWVKVFDYLDGDLHDTCSVGMTPYGYISPASMSWNTP